ncbi:MAG: response regulator, partial [Opitutaceae bacterium]
MTSFLAYGSTSVAHPVRGHRRDAHMNAEAPRAKAPSTVLVVDDDPSVLGLVASVLSRRRYQVLTAESPAAALALWREHGPTIDVLLTDVVMPGDLSGVDLANRLSAQRKDLIVVYMTGHAQRPDLAPERLQAQGRRLIAKPFTIDGLLEA